MIKYFQGDLFDTKLDIICHGVNCQGVFGSGVARLMALVYPKAKWYYFDKHNEDGWKLGDVQFVLQRDGKYIANCATQDKYLPRNKCHADYEAIRKCLSIVKDFAKAKGLSIAMPKIGAGLAGGDWDTIEGVLNEVFCDYDVTIYYLDL